MSVVRFGHARMLSAHDSAISWTWLLSAITVIDGSGGRSFVQRQHFSPSRARRAKIAPSSFARS